LIPRQRQKTKGTKLQYRALTKFNAKTASKSYPKVLSSYTRTFVYGITYYALRAVVKSSRNALQLSKAIGIVRTTLSVVTLL